MRRDPSGLSTRTAFWGGLCVLGAVGAFAGMVLQHDPLFLGGLCGGVAGYLGIRRGLKRSLDRVEGNGSNRER